MKYSAQCEGQKSNVCYECVNVENDERECLVLNVTSCPTDTRERKLNVNLKILRKTQHSNLLQENV